jgi:hypothetical protein
MSSIAAKPAAGLLVVVVALLAGCSTPAPDPTLPGTSAEQACTTPQVTLSHSTIDPGSPVTVQGVDWTACDDTPNNPAPSAWTTVAVDFLQGEEEVRLSTAPLRDGAFTTEVTLPLKAQPGEATISVSSGDFSTAVTVEIVDDEQP